MKSQTAIEGDLILIKTKAHTVRPRPVIARSVKPTASWSWLIRLVLWILVSIAPLIPHWPPRISATNRVRLAILAIVALAVVEVLAQGYAEKALTGVMT